MKQGILDLVVKGLTTGVQLRQGPETNNYFKITVCRYAYVHG